VPASIHLGAIRRGPSLLAEFCRAYAIADRPSITRRMCSSSRNTNGMLEHVQFRPRWAHRAYEIPICSAADLRLFDSSPSRRRAAPPGTSEWHRARGGFPSELRCPAHDSPRRWRLPSSDARSVPLIPASLLPSAPARSISEKKSAGHRRRRLPRQERGEIASVLVFSSPRWSYIIHSIRLFAARSFGKPCKQQAKQRAAQKLCARVVRRRITGLSCSAESPPPQTHGRQRPTVLDYCAPFRREPHTCARCKLSRLQAAESGGNPRHGGGNLRARGRRQRARSASTRWAAGDALNELISISSWRISNQKPKPPPWGGGDGGGARGSPGAFPLLAMGRGGGVGAGSRLDVSDFLDSRGAKAKVYAMIVYFVADCSLHFCTVFR